MLSAGEGGLVVELGDSIDPALNARVHGLARAVREQLPDEALELVPTYRSLLVIHDPIRVARERLSARIEALLADLPPAEAGELPGRIVHLPACYGGEHGPDLEAVAAHAGLSPEEVVRIHSEATYLVAMLGFTPGFPYLGGMSSRIATPRLGTPRTRIPAGVAARAGINAWRRTSISRTLIQLSSRESHGTRADTCFSTREEMPAGTFT
jgi:inhibitor of KinA